MERDPRNPSQAKEIREAQVVYGSVSGEDREPPAEADARSLARLLLKASAARKERVESLIEAMISKVQVPSPVAVLQARRNAEAREALIQELGVLTSTGVAELAGSQAKNRAALANRWKQERRIFSVQHQGVTVFPGYQLDTAGRPRPVIAEVVERLGSHGSEWELALWFVAETGWLSGRRQVDLLDRDPRAVAEAASREAAESVF
jgi:hypothetical protein